MRQTNNICIFDIRNIQEEYAYTLEFIEHCEQGGEKADYNEKLSKLISIADKIAIKGGKVDKGIPVRYFEEPIERVIEQTEKGIIREDGIDKLTELKSATIIEKSFPFFVSQEMLYHVRVHLDSVDTKGNLMNLQYLALMLQKLERLFWKKSDVKKRLSVFIVPDAGKPCPYISVKDKGIGGVKENINNDLYNMVSRYLRLLSKEYVGILYSAKKHRNELTICPLDYDVAPQSDEFFPVLIIDGENYFELFEKPIPIEKINELFDLPKRRRYGNAAEPMTENALCDYIGETAFRRLEKSVGLEEGILAKIQNKISKETDINWIMFAIFCFTFRTYLEDSIRKDIYLTWENARDLYMGIKQVVQNSIQHSEKHSCMFSFMLRSADKEKRTFTKTIDMLYEDTSAVFNEYKNCTNALEIVIADLNYQQSMIDNFVDNLSWEYEKLKYEGEFEGHKALIEQRENISLRNFFSEFDETDIKEAWSKFRQQDISAHVGLLLFATAAQRCNASIKVYSSTSYEQDSEKEYYYKPYGKRENKIYKLGRKCHIIPGTQFSMLIPLVPFRKMEPNSLGQLSAKGKIEENYKTFADYIEYKEEKIQCLEIFNTEIGKLVDGNYVTNSKEKFEAVRTWKKIWELVFEKNFQKRERDKTIFYVNMGEIQKNSYFRNTDNIEVFIKGLLESIFLLDKYQIKALAFKGAEPIFVQIFRDSCIVFSSRKFPKGFQMFVGEKDCVNNLHLFGNTFFQAIANSYIMSIEHGSKIMGTMEYAIAKKIYENIEDINVNTGEESIRVIPFDVILSSEGDSKQKIFENRIRQLSNNDIDGDDAGFLIRNTHMRLGSKVHIQSFYEMSFLFYRTSIANRIAFEILQDLYEKSVFEVINLEEDTLVFYGYASYSKAILTSLTEILKAYRRSKKGEDTNIDSEVSFVSYQHNLQSESEDIQMYYGFSETFPAKRRNEKVICDERIRIIQIVPISSTLTTFEKMWSRLKKDIDKASDENFELVGNYTVFWVTNKNKDSVELPTDIEENYWSKVNLKLQTVTTNFEEFKLLNTTSVIRFFIRCPVTWLNPLDCKLCYPRQLLDEIPLVETDQTSTVPTQQIRKSRTKNINNCNGENDARIKKLKDCVSYGHIMRDQNHFQYYIDTQEYFYRVKEEVREWLKGCAVNDNISSGFPILHIIFSPEHNTNVGFAQYVNTYYLGGIAEIVSINEDKEFRSNFECEHTALIETISDLYRYIEIHSLKDMPVRFYYVDDTIISGETFQKANSFLRSLLPTKYKNNYGTNIISECFVLVDRLSKETKRNYVRDVDKDFHSFVHIDISNMRTQGDSCVGCKLKQDAVKLFKRSSTRNIAHYWAEKIKHYEPIMYDEKKEINRYQTCEAYFKLVVSHVAQNTIFLNNDSYQLGNAYDAILTIAFKMLNVKKNQLFSKVKFNFDDLIKEVSGIEGIGILLKIVSRPFFTFDFKVKMQVLTLIIVLTEFVLGNEEELNQYKFNPDESYVLKEFIVKNNRLKLTIHLAENILENLKNTSELDFLKDVLLECLTDMKSTYILRKKTIKSIYDFSLKYKNGVGDFWRSYAKNVHQIVDCSSDEMRSLSLEYLLLSGLEYKEFKVKYDKQEEFLPRFLYEAITGEVAPQKREPFYIFCHELFLQNTRILFDGIDKELRREQTSDTYFMEQWRCLKKLQEFQIYVRGQGDCLPTDEEKDLFRFLEEKGQNDTQYSRREVKKHYEELLNEIFKMVHAKYNVVENGTKVALLTWTQDDTASISLDAEVGQMDILTDINLSTPEKKYDVKQKVVDALNAKEERVFQLKKDGYIIEEEKDDISYFVIYFDNPEKRIPIDKGRTLKPIAKVFLYFEICKVERSFFYLRFMLRDLLTYRNRLLRMMENDFAGDMFTKYAHTIGEKNIIAHEKATSHNNTIDNENILGFLVKQNVLKKYDNLDSSQAAEWLLMRSYVNEQIAKLFNRSFQDKKDDEEQPSSTESPVLYIDDSAELYYKESYFNKKLQRFTDLGLIMDDRFNLLEKIIHIEYNDLLNIQFVTEQGRGYNVEFIKCVFIDILFSAIKHETGKYEFLLQIDSLLGKRKILRNDGLIPQNQEITKMKNEDCIVKFSVEKTASEVFDYLVIRNPVYGIMNDWEYKNGDIKKRLEDPLDYPDGHLSLLTIKRYIEGLSEKLVGKTKFGYYEDSQEMLWFESKLPIVKKEDNQ